MILINAFIAYWSWKVAKDSFELDNKLGGWICVVISATNGGVVLYGLFGRL